MENWRIIQSELTEALEEAITGYEWRKEEWPEQWDKSDDEHLEKCKKALKKYKKAIS